MPRGIPNKKKPVTSRKETPAVKTDVVDVDKFVHQFDSDPATGESQQKPSVKDMAHAVHALEPPLKGQPDWASTAAIDEDAIREKAVHDLIENKKPLEQFPQPILPIGEEPLGQFRGKSLISLLPPTESDSVRLTEQPAVVDVPVTDENPIVRIPDPKTPMEYAAISHDTDGWFSDAEANLLYWVAVEALRIGHNTWIEVGSYKGKTSVILAGVLARHGGLGTLYAIDPHEGKLSYPSHFEPNGLLGSNRMSDTESPTLQAFRDTIDKADLWSWIVLVQAEFSRFTIEERTVALAFIDGLHDYDSVLADYTHVKPMLTSDATVMFHDYKQWDGPTRVVDDAVAAHELTIINQVDSLVVCRRV